MQNIILPEGFGFIKEMMIDQFINILGWIAEEESNKKSERVKLAVRKKNGRTLSYKGNKWGRKTISKQKINKIISLRKEGMKIKDISAEVKAGIGTVHRTLQNFQNTPPLFDQEEHIPIEDSKIR